jgi:hypothetical protein
MFNLKTIALATAAIAVLAAPASARPNVGDATASTCRGVICMKSFETVDRNEFERKMRFSYRGRMDVKYYKVTYVDLKTGLTTRIVNVIADSSNFESHNWAIKVSPNQTYKFNVKACTAANVCTTTGRFTFNTRA